MRLNRVRSLLRGGVSYRAMLIVAIVTMLALIGLYVLVVGRGQWGMREELPWEIAASGESPVRTHIYAEQRLPEYQRGLGWLKFVLADVHAVDVRVRWAYWHEEEFPNFDQAPGFVLEQ